MELGIGAGSEETRMTGLPDGFKSFKIGLAVLMQYRRVTDTHPASIHVAVASTRYALSPSRSKNLWVSVHNITQALQTKLHFQPMCIAERRTLAPGCVHLTRDYICQVH